MEHHKVISFQTINQINHLHLRPKNVEINDDAPGSNNTNKQIKFKTLMLKSCLFDYSDEYILVSETIIVKTQEQ